MQPKRRLNVIRGWGGRAEFKSPFWSCHLSVLAIMPVVFIFNMVGDGLRDVLDLGLRGLL